MKHLRLFALMLAAATFAACDDDEGTTTGGGGNGDVTPVSSGVLIVNQGNEGYGLEGDFTTVDYMDGYSAVTGRFAAVNGRSLGLTPNRSCIHGGKIYTAVTSSNTVEVCGKGDFRSVAQIALAGNDTLSQPRDVVGQDGYVYVSLYSGHVCKIDTTDFSIVGAVAVGQYPEDMVIAGGKLYVPNCNYSYGTTVSEIDLASFTRTRDITVPVNPVKMEADAQGNVYLLCSGEYLPPSYNQVGAAVWRLDLNGGNHVKVADATLMDIPAGTNTLYVADFPYGATSATYASVDLTQSTYTPVSLSLSADSPAGIAVDPVNGNIVLTSYGLNDVGGASYNTPGYANIYDAAGTLLCKVETGIGPCAIYFLTEHVD